MSKTAASKTSDASGKINLTALNLSGIRPTEFKVLVEVKEVEKEKKIGSITLVTMTDTEHERHQMAEMEGTLVAVSPLAFSYAEWPNKADVPKPGDSVVFQKFAGANRIGKDGRTYRLINDKDIVAVLE